MKSSRLLEELKQAITEELIEDALKKAAQRIDQLVDQRVQVNSQYLSVGKACEYLDISRATFYKLLETHQPTKYMLHNSPRYHIADLDKMHTLVY